MAKKDIKHTMQFAICDYCINYLIKDIKSKPKNLTVRDWELLKLFHQSTPLIRRTILSLLRNLQSEKSDSR